MFNSPAINTRFYTHHVLASMWGAGVPVSQMRKRKHREAKRLAQGHTAPAWPSWAPAVRFGAFWPHSASCSALGWWALPQTGLTGSTLAEHWGCLVHTPPPVCFLCTTLWSKPGAAGGGRSWETVPPTQRPSSKPLGFLLRTLRMVFQTVSKARAALAVQQSDEHFAFALKVGGVRGAGLHQIRWLLQPDLRESLLCGVLRRAARPLQGEPGVEWGQISNLSVTDVAEASGSAWPWAVGPGAGSWGDAE